MFKKICIAWGIGLTLVTFGLVVKSAPSSAPSVPSVALARQAEPNREQLINRVTQRYERMVYMCDYIAQFSLLAPQANLIHTCANVRVAGREAIAQMKTTTMDLNSLSRAVDQLEIELATPLRNMEAAYATMRQIR